MAEFKIRLDRSKPHGTNHGDMTPEDPAYMVRFWQGGTMGGKKIVLPFDINGELIPDDGRTEKFEGINSEGKKVWYTPLYSADMRKYLELRRQRHAQTAIAAPDPNAIDEEETSHDNELGASIEDEINFESWLKGEVKYPPFQIRAAALKRYSKRYPNIYPDLVVDLVLDERLVPEDQVCADLRKYLPARATA